MAEELLPSRKVEQLKSLTYLWQLALLDCGARCCTSTGKDLETVLARLEHEGLSFLTISLPSFGSDFERSLDRGYVANDLFTGFRFRGGLPELFSGFLSLVFEHGSGRLLSDPSVDSIFSIRQLTRMFSKILLPCTQARIEGAIDGYLSVEQELKERDARHVCSPVFQQEVAHVKRLFSLLWADACSAVDHSIAEYALVPSHGPGATADGRLGNQKFRQSEWTDRLEAVFPYGEYGVPNWGHYLSSVRNVRFLEPGAERPVKVITVPKTLKSPRIIAVEPTCMQYMQQGIAIDLTEELERVRDHSHSRHFIGFSHQEPNQLLAREGSLTGQLATLDLSEASDRLSNSLVRSMLTQWPHLADGVDACRSRKAKVRGKTIRLAKFASMGSALTFPLEAMCFVALVFRGIEKSLNRPLSRKDFKFFRGRVRVYGDDIVVPVDFVPQVIRTLEGFDLKVNTDKSFWNGKFRESCGKEYYDGHDVSIVKIRRVPPASLADAEEMISYISLRNQAQKAQLPRLVAHLDEQLLVLTHGHFPFVRPESPLLGRHHPRGFYEVERMSTDLHAPQVRGYVVKATSPINSIDDVPALLKFLLKRGLEPFADVEHLKRSGRPSSVNIERKWAQPF